MTARASEQLRAALVILVGLALVFAVLANLPATARADDRYISVADRVAWTMTPARARSERAHADTSCLPGAIQTALARAAAACGITVISTYRPGARIAGTRHPSKHGTCEAADFTSKNYRCVYAVLASWPGKLSIDPGRVRHVHIDDGRYARFVHANSRRYAKANQQRRTRLARHR